MTVLLVVALQTLVDRLVFEKAAPESEAEKKVVELLSRRETWTEAVRTIEGTFGRFPEALRVRVDYSLTGDEAGQASLRDGAATVRFNVKLLGELQKKAEDAETRPKEAQDRSGKLVYRVPPVRIDRVVAHELTHVLQGDLAAPEWFREGMAQWIGDDPNNLYAFGLTHKAVQDIDGIGLERRGTYARGHLFWAWLNSCGAAKKAGELSLSRRAPWKEALEQATGKPWAEIVAAEREWSSTELQKYRPK